MVTSTTGGVTPSAHEPLPAAKPPDPETGSRGPYGSAHAAFSGERPRPPAAPAAGERPRRARVAAALVAAGGALLVAATVSVLFGGLGGTEPRPVFCPGDRCASTTGKASPPPGLRYRTVERDVGYFEGTVTIVNRGARPVRAWTLSFTYPGADVHNAWEVVLRQKGQNVVIVNAPTAEPIRPGDSFEVRFGGAGRPSMPTGCRLNGAPCTFIG
jgi:cellulose binding protein with CBM2 domain